MQQREQRHAVTWLLGEASGSAQLVRCMVMDKGMKLQAWGMAGGSGAELQGCHERGF